MAKRSTKTIDLLPGSTEIEVVAIAPGKDPVVKIMTIDEADSIKKKRGWSYQRYQKGFSQYKTK
jgi:hypothetical protein